MTGDDLRPSRLQRGLVLATLAVLVVAGLREVEAWPLTAWRLFSAERTAEQAGWVVETSDRAGQRTRLSLDVLPLGHRSATAQLSVALRDGTARAVCSALRAAAVEVRPGVVGLHVLRDRRRLVRDGSGWRTEHSLTEVVSCGPQP